MNFVSVLIVKAVKRLEHGEDIMNGRLTTIEKDEIRTAYEFGVRIKELAQNYFLDSRTIRYWVDDEYCKRQKRISNKSHKKRSEKINATNRERWKTNSIYHKTVSARNKIRRLKPESKRKRNEQERKLRVIYRSKCLEILGGICKCLQDNCCHDGPCQIIDPEALVMDHINGGGRKDRKKHPLTGLELRRLANNPNELKSKYQILCANCNIKKMFREGER